MEYRLEEIAMYSNKKIEIDKIDFENYISTENMLSNKLGITKATALPNQSKVNFFEKQNILISNIRPYFKKIWFADSSGGCSNDVLNIVVKDSTYVLPKFLYYNLFRDEFFEYVMSGNKGTKMPRGDKHHIMQYIINIPNIEMQSKIVNILEKIDKKIDINNQINDNLYEVLKQLYNNLYLKNRDYNLWENITLDETTSKFATGLNPRKNFILGKGQNYYVTIKNMRDNQIVLDDKCDKVTDEALLKINKRSDLKIGDLLFSGIGTIGRTYLITSKPTNWNISESIFTIRPNEKITSEFLYLLLLSSDVQNYAISLASGSVQKGIRMADLKRYAYKLPCKQFIVNFTNNIKPMLQIIDNNQKENRTLEQLRDTLLPKLMNSEIDLDNIGI